MRHLYVVIVTVGEAMTKISRSARIQPERYGTYQCLQIAYRSKKITTNLAYVFQQILVWIKQGILICGNFLIIIRYRSPLSFPQGWNNWRRRRT